MQIKRADLKRSVGMVNPYQGKWLVPVRVADGPVTKWDMLGDADRLAIEDVEVALGPMPPARCAGCQADVRTEGMFARHFLIPDLRWWNLGDCPVTAAAEAEAAEQEDDEDEDECEGHESPRGDSMGASVFCDGTCR